MDGDRRQPPLTFSLDGQGLGILGMTADRVPAGVCVRVVGEMDIATAPQLVAAMRSLSRPDLQHVWLDLTGLTFVDAAGLAALVEVRRLVDGQGGRLTLRGVSPLVRRLLTITKLAREFTLEPNLSAPHDRQAPPGSATPDRV
jgi:anti-sigma B factor antagonist